MVAEPVPFKARISVVVAAADPLSRAGIVSQLRRAQGFGVVGDGELPEDVVGLVVGDELDAEVLGSMRALRGRGVRRVVLLVSRVDDRSLLAAAEAGELWLETPRDGAPEGIAFADDEEPAASLGSNAQPVGPWADLVTRLRGLADEVTAHPAAALELVGDAAGARLVAVGDGALDVDTASVSVRVVRLDAAGAMLGRWQAPSEATEVTAATDAGWTATGPGWAMDLPFGHGLEAGTGEWLQVWVFVRVRDGDARDRRAARLFLAVPGAR